MLNIFSIMLFDTDRMVDQLKEVKELMDVIAQVNSSGLLASSPCLHTYIRTYIHTFFYWLVPQRGFSESDIHYIRNPNWWDWLFTSVGEEMKFGSPM